MKVGDLVYIEGARAIVGRVREVSDDEGITVTWQTVSTCEDEDDLNPVEPEHESTLDLCERWIDTRDNLDRVTAELTARTGKEPEEFIASMRELFTVPA